MGGKVNQYECMTIGGRVGKYHVVFERVRSIPHQMLYLKDGWVITTDLQSKRHNPRLVYLCKVI